MLNIRSYVASILTVGMLANASASDLERITDYTGFDRTLHTVKSSNNPPYKELVLHATSEEYPIICAFGHDDVVADQGRLLVYTSPKTITVRHGHAEKVHRSGSLEFSEHVGKCTQNNF